MPRGPTSRIPASYIVVKADQTLTAEDLEAFVAERVATYKQLRKITFVDAIPKSASGKILRRLLRERLAPNKGEASS